MYWYRFSMLILSHILYSYTYYCIESERTIGLPWTSLTLLSIMASNHPLTLHPQDVAVADNEFAAAPHLPLAAGPVRPRDARGSPRRDASLGSLRQKKCTKVLHFQLVFLFCQSFLFFGWNFSEPKHACIALLTTGSVSGLTRRFVQKRTECSAFWRSKDRFLCPAVDGHFSLAGDDPSATKISWNGRPKLPSSHRGQVHRQGANLPLSTWNLSVKAGGMMAKSSYLIDIKWNKCLNAPNDT